MLLEGHVENGRIVWDAPPGLAEGSAVRLEIPSRLDAIKAAVARARQTPDAGPTLAERLAPIIGTGTDLPADFAARHDHYIHGAGE